MTVADLFASETKTVNKIFNTGERHSFIVPLYQRPYSWDSEHVTQLLDDIATGLTYYLEEPESQVHFLGTLITIENSNYKQHQNDLDVRKALSKTIEDIIDGQQRLSTIAVISTEAHFRITSYLNALDELGIKTDPMFLDVIKDPAIDYLYRLSGLFSYTVRHQAEDLKKPILIRDSDDKWLVEEPEDLSNYNSNISKFIASYIKKAETSLSVADGALQENLKIIKKFFDTIIDEETVATENFDVFPNCRLICTKVQHEEIWGFDRSSELLSLIDSECSHIVKPLIKLLAFSFFLLERCCFTHIQPKTESSAFDLFQSLNATGTPLTALETFKPDVVRTVEVQGETYKSSASHFYFTEVEDQFSQLTSAQSKNDRTNEYLLLFRQSSDGKKLRKHFSEQLKWLKKSFHGLKDYQSKEGFLHKMSSTAKYSRLLIYPNSSSTIINNFNREIISNYGQDIEEELLEESKVALIFILEAKHKISHIVLNRFFHELKKIGSGSSKLELAQDFCKAIRFLAAYFIYMRGLGKYPDLEYRKIIEMNFNWFSDSSMPITFDDFSTIAKSTLPKYLEKVSEVEGPDKEKWFSRASSNINYENNISIVKLLLMMSFNNTVPDDEPGLMKTGKKGSTMNYLSAKAWSSRELKTVEHICPQNVPEPWSSDIFQEGIQHQLGNLTLLPHEINTSLSDKPWLWKLIYYKFLATRDPDAHNTLLRFASDNGVELPDSTQALLSEASFYSHVESIAQFSFNTEWTVEIIEARTRRILEIAWEKLNDWLNR